MDSAVALLTSPLFRAALLEAIVVGALCGLVGVHVVLRRLPFFTMALSHAIFPGVVLAALAGVSLILGAGAFGAGAALAIAQFSRRDEVDPTSATGVVLAGAFGLGVLVMSAQAGFTKDLAAYLVGSIATVGTADVVATLVVGACIAAALALLHKELVLGAFDRQALVALGYPAAVLDAGVLALVAATVVTAIPAVGTILAVALLVAPAATARLWTDRVVSAMALAAALGALSGGVGLWVSLTWNVAAGGAIVLVAAALFALSLVVSPRHGLIPVTGLLRQPAHAALPRRGAARDSDG